MSLLAMPEPTSDVRKRRFKEVIEYALERVSTGGQRASQRQLAEKIMCAPGMIRRYLDMETSVEGLKFLTIQSLARACRLDPGSLFLWVEKGREAAMLHEAALNGTMPPFSALDLAKQLVQLLEQDGGASASPGDAPVDSKPPGLNILRQRLNAMEEETGHLFPRLLRMTDAEDAVDRVNNPDATPTDLGEADWEALSRLLEVEVATLKLECHGSTVAA